VDILSAPDIELSGAQTLGELLKFVPAVSGNATSTAISNGGDGTATVTLRGLPASNTLVLINGRRVANDGLAGESVDLNSIPPAAVERIEILKDGASAIYGSDAIAGVVNVIMKQDFHGLLVEGFYGQAQEGDLETATQTLQYGTGISDGSFFISASHYKQEPIYSRDREISQTPDTRSLGGSDQRSSATPGSRVLLPNGQTVIAEGTGYRPATDEDLFNYQAFTTAVVPIERLSVYTNASYDFNEQVTGFVELSYTDTEATAILAPTPVFTAFEQEPLSVAADARYNPFGAELHDVRRRLIEFPERQQRNESEVMRFSMVVEGLFSDWNWDAAYNWSRSEATEITRGIVNADLLQRAIGPAANCQGVDIDGCVPVNLLSFPGSISPEQVQYIAATGEVSGYTKLTGLSFNLSRALTLIPAGGGGGGGRNSPWALNTGWNQPAKALQTCSPQRVPSAQPTLRPPGGTAIPPSSTSNCCNQYGRATMGFTVLMWKPPSVTPITATSAPLPIPKSRFASRGGLRSCFGPIMQRDSEHPA